MKVTIPADYLCPYCGKGDPQSLDRTKCALCKTVFVLGDETRAVRYDDSEAEQARREQLARLVNPPPGTRIYKVLTQRDQFFQSKFNPESLQALINIHAVEGWRVVSMTATDVGSFWGSFWGKGGGASRQELLVLMERTVE